MSTRLYPGSTGLGEGSVGFPFNPGYSGSWTTTSPTNNPVALVTNRARLIQDLGAAHDPTTTGWVSGNSHCDERYLSDPLNAQIISGTVKGRVRAWEDASGDHANVAMVLRVISTTGAARGTLLGLTSGSAMNNLNPEDVVAASASGAVNRELPFGSGSPVTLTSVTCLSGDRLLLEVGHALFTTTVGVVSATDIPPDMGSDLPEDTTTSTRLNPWIELSQALSFFAGPAAPGGWRP